MANDTYTLKYTGKEIEDKLDKIPSIETKLSNVENSTKSNAGKIETINTVIGKYSDSINKNTNAISANQKKIDQLEGKNVQLTAKIEEQNKEFTQINTSLAEKVENTIYQQKVNELEQADKTLLNQISQSSINITSDLLPRIETNTNNIQNNADSIEGIRIDISDLKISNNSLKELSETVKNLSTAQDSLSSLVGEVKSTTDNAMPREEAENAHNDLSSQISNFQSTYVPNSTYESYKSEITLKFTQLEFAVEELKNNYSNLIQRIEALENKNKEETT